MADSEVDLRRSDDAIAAVATAWRTTLRVTAVWWVLVCVVVAAALVLGERDSGWWLFLPGVLVPPLLAVALLVWPARRRARAPWSELGERDRMRVSAAGRDPVRIDALAPRLRLAATVRLRLLVVVRPASMSWGAWQFGGFVGIGVMAAVAEGRWSILIAPALILLMQPASLVAQRRELRDARATLAALS